MSSPVDETETVGATPPTLLLSGLDSLYVLYFLDMATCARRQLIKAAPSPGLAGGWLAVLDRPQGAGGGEEGIRTLERGLAVTPLAGERLQPLGHLSAGGNSPVFRGASRTGPKRRSIGRDRTPENRGLIIQAPADHPAKNRIRKP